MSATAAKRPRAVRQDQLADHRQGGSSSFQLRSALQKHHEFPVGVAENAARPRIVLDPSAGRGLAESMGGMFVPTFPNILKRKGNFSLPRQCEGSMI